MPKYFKATYTQATRGVCNIAKKSSSFYIKQETHVFYAVEKRKYTRRKRTEKKNQSK